MFIHRHLPVPVRIATNLTEILPVASNQSRSANSQFLLRNFDFFTRIRDPNSHTSKVMTRMSDSLSYLDLSSQPGQNISGWRQGVAHFRRYALTSCFILMAGALGLTLLKSTLHNELRDLVAGEINKRLEDSAFRCNLRDAHWTEGKGLRLSGIRFTHRTTGQVVVDCEQVYASSPFQLTDLLAGKPTIDSVTIDQARIACFPDESGSNCLTELFESLKCEDTDELDCPIRIRNSQVTIHAPMTGLARPLTIRGINVDHSGDKQNPSVNTWKGSLSSDVSNRLDFQVSINRDSSVWTATCRGERIELNDRLSSLLEEVAGPNSLLDSLRGRISLNAGATGRIGSDELPLFEIAGRADNLQCLDSSLPHRIHDGSCEFRIDNRQQRTPRISIKDASFQLGYGTIHANLTIADPLNQLRWRLVGKANDLQLTERLVPWLSPDHQRVWHHYQPTGHIDATFDLQFDGNQLSRDIKTRIRDGSYSWHRFPFRVSQCNGTINLIDDELSVDFQAVEAQQLVNITAEIKNPGPDWYGWLEGSCEGNIPINEKLLQAFDHVRPTLARSLRKFNASGHVNGWGRVERMAGSSIVSKHYDINLRQATIRHENFDYPIHNVNGLIVVENDKTTFRSINGQNNHGEIECNGTWTPINGLQLRFLANNVLLNDELHAALPANLRKTWTGLRPAGTLDLVDLDLHTLPGSPRPMIGVTVEISGQRKRPSTVSINPIWFPYEMRQVTGKFRFENQRIEIRDFTAVHGRTALRANGRGAYNESDWRVRFSDMFGSNIVLDEALRRALPPSVSTGLERMKFDGKLVMRGAMEITGVFDDVDQADPGAANSVFVSTREPTRPTANLGWDLEFGMAKANAYLGVPISNASGTVRLKGRYAGGKVHCVGTLNVDSMMYRDIQITSLTAPLSINNQMIGIGALATSENPQAATPSATGRIFGGYIECDAQVELGGENTYLMQAALTDGSLRDFATETSMQQQDFSGQAYAGIRLHGDSSGAHSTRGTGYISLQNAKIYEVPVVLALLNVLRIKEPDRTAFDQGQMEFTVRGENIDFQKIELNGDAISLIGQGSVNLNSEVDLDFYTMVGRNRWSIPVLTKLYHAGSQQVWWVEVDGTLGNPKTSHQVLPGLNESLKRLFPEFATDSSR